MRVNHSATRVVWTLTLCTSLALLGDSTLYAVLPSYHPTVGISVVQVGWLLSMNRLVRPPLNMLSGWLSQRIGARTPYIVGLSIGALSTLGYGLCRGFWPLLAMRALWGVAWALLAVSAYGLMLDVTAEDTRGRLAGIYTSISYFGGSAGAMLGGFLVDTLALPRAMLILGILGVQQSLGEALRQSGLAVDWAGFGGPYARSKVDFHEVCDAQQALGPDLLNKSVFRGARYTAVLIGPGGQSYLLRSDAAAGMTEYVAALNAYLTDAYAILLSGALVDPALRSAAERAGLWRGGAPAASVITQEAMARYAPTADAVSAITASYFADKVGTMRALLASTTGGRQGVPPENMMLNLWRYVRRSMARGLYAEGILTNRLPETGLTTVFYANDVAMLARLLG